MTNSTGIIDPNYLGSFKVALTKIDKTKPDIELPFRCCQIIMEKKIEFEVEIIEDEEDLDETERGEGGFGSTGIN